MSSFKLPTLLKDKIDLTYLEYPTMGYSEDQVLLIKQIPFSIYYIWESNA